MSKQENRPNEIEMNYERLVNITSLSEICYRAVARAKVLGEEVSRAFHIDSVEDYERLDHIQWRIAGMIVSAEILKKVFGEEDIQKKIEDQIVFDSFRPGEESDDLNEIKKDFTGITPRKILDYWGYEQVAQDVLFRMEEFADVLKQNLNEEFAVKSRSKVMEVMARLMVGISCLAVRLGEKDVNEWVMYQLACEEKAIRINEQMKTWEESPK